MALENSHTLELSITLKMLMFDPIVPDLIHMECGFGISLWEVLKAPSTTLMCDKVRTTSLE